MKIVLSLFVIALAIATYGQQTQTLDSKVTGITLFLSGAQVTRAAQATLPAGLTDLTFTGLSESIDPNTIRLTGEGDFTIISVNHRINFLKTQKVIKDEEILRSLKAQLEKQLKDNEAQKAVIGIEENLLKANQKIGIADKGTTTQELKLAADFFRIRFTELSDKKLELARKDESINLELQKINDQLNEVSGEEVKPTGEIFAQVMVKDPIHAKFKLSYLVRKASWKPEFDLRVDDISKPLEMSRRAKISQNSGEDWKDIKLTLSTGNPNESGTEPILRPWYIGGNYSGYLNLSNQTMAQPNYSQVDKPYTGTSYAGTVKGRVFSVEDGIGIAGATIVVKGRSGGVSTDIDGNYTLYAPPGSEIQYSFIGMIPVTTRADNPVINIGMQPSSVQIEGVVVTALGISKEANDDEYGNMRKTKPDAQKPEYLQIETNGQQVRSVKEYMIAMIMNMPSDGKEYNLVIGSETIPADYEFHAVPKLDRDAFLVAKVTNWQDYDLLDATAGIFYEGTFTGKTRLSASLATDTLDISLGRDKSIMVDRKKVKDFTISQLLGSNRTLQRAWEISLRNNKKQPITLIVLDQYPVSREKEIEVELIDDSGAIVDKETGILRWKVSLEPGQLKKLKFRYSVKFPKERIITVE